MAHRHFRGPSPALTIQLNRQITNYVRMCVCVCACVCGCAHLLSCVNNSSHAQTHSVCILEKEGQISSVQQQTSWGKRHVKQPQVAEKKHPVPDGKITWDWMMWREENGKSVLPDRKIVFTRELSSSVKQLWSNQKNQHQMVAFVGTGL